MTTIYERIKNRRKELGLTADDVAQALNVSRATIYRYESSEIEKLPTSTLEPLSEVLKTTPAYLMGWDESSETKDVITKEEQEHLQKYRSIDGKGKHTVDTVLEMEYNRCNEPSNSTKSTDIIQLENSKKKYTPTEEDIRSLVARNGRKMTREEAIEFISEMFSEDEEE